jgi:cbb3-type cytochrome oxidase subunit 1
MAQHAARAYWRFAVLWLIVGCALGTLAALSFLAPDTFGQHALLGFGRLAAAHRAAMIHGVLFSAVFACCFTLLPRMNRAMPVPRPLSVFIAWFGSAVVLWGVLGILSGAGSGQEYADFPRPIGFLFWLFLVAVALDLSFQLASAKTLAPHPSQGLLLAAATIPAVVYPFGLPDWLGSGLFAALRTWIGWRTIFIASFAASAVGLSLWLMGSREREVVIKRGPFMLGVVLLVGLAPFTGIVHLLDAPLSPGLKAWGAFAGVLLATGIILLVITIWRKSACDPAGFLNVCGLAGLVGCSVQGVLMVLPPIHDALHYTMNTSGHAHLALGSIVCIFLSGAMVLAPRIAQRELVGAGRAMSAAVLFVGGLVIVFLSQTATGLVQAAAFAGGGGSSNWLQAVRWIQVGTLSGGVAAFIGALMIGSMVLRTLSLQSTSPQSIPSRALEGGES